MKKLFLIPFLLFLSCKTDTDLMNEIKAKYYYNLTIEEFTNRAAGVTGNVDWKFVKYDNVNDPNIVFLQSHIKTRNGYLTHYTNEEIECIFRWMYNTNTKQVALWYESIGDNLIFNEGKYCEKVTYPESKKMVENRDKEVQEQAEAPSDNTVSVEPDTTDPDKVIYPNEGE